MTAMVVVPAHAWHQRAACVDLGDVMFPAPRDRAGEAEAKRVCRNCPVARHCLTESLTARDFEGVRAGLNGRERERLAAGQRLQRCGRCSGWFVAQWPAQVRCRSCSPRAGQSGVESC